ncbi:MAG: PAAR domain-containing protein [Chloroflexi bacterium]|nr:PAAR domain-containing protein [Chloroflexota bacterium]MCI0574683.1 PAAR domain-containing protein [Chloroflexota bacterium]MCI0647424.1 PAAR domain-containing protein [Chloroflexota bacterium]MCI0726868.1 PAAR domain-containing protein [Chloroflexota bacterium]
MGQPAAKQGDQVTAVDTHIIMIPSPGGPVPTPLPHPFNGMIDGNLSTNVKIEGRPAATVGSTASNTPPHIPQGGPFQIPPTNQGVIMAGSSTVMINGKPAARTGDQCQTCADPVPNMSGRVVVPGSTVMIGG